MTKRPVVFRNYHIKGGPYWMPKFRVTRYDEGIVYRFWCLRVFVFYRVSYVPPMSIWQYVSACTMLTKIARTGNE